MNTIHKHLLASVISIAFLSPVMADETHQNGCENATVKLGSMGVVNEQALQEHIDKLNEQMTRVRHAGSSQLTKNKELKQHIEDMQAAMQELHNQMYAGGCKEAIHGASMETRVEVMEKRIGMMQQMMEQLVNHMSEQTK